MRVDVLTLREVPVCTLFEVLETDEFSMREVPS